jgi:hypothetical protein
MQVDAMMAFGRWVASGRKANVDGWPELSKKDALAIIRVLLPLLDIKKELRMGNFKTVKDCNKWLGEIWMGTTWDAEMEALTEQECTIVICCCLMKPRLLITAVLLVLLGKFYFYWVQLNK